MAIARHSKKRDAMLALLRGTDVHPGADWVFRELRPSFPGLSLGTVYRNLRQLTEEGYIRSIGVIGGQERFDGRVTPHAHFVCERCGRVLDVELPEDFKAPPAAGIYRVTGGEVRLRGICSECGEK